MNNRISLCVFAVAGAAFLAGCAGMRGNNENAVYETPGVDYVENLDVYSAPHKDSFLNQLAMNYRSYAVYNARTSGYPDVGELFAQKAIGAFSGERPFPESLENWRVSSENERFEIYNAYNELIDMLKSDAIQLQPQLAAESQAKFDCWLSASASGQGATALECKNRFFATMQALRDCIEGKTVAPMPTTTVAETLPHASEQYYPETHSLSAMSGSTRAREGLVIVNNVNIPSNLVQVVPVPAAQPVAAQAQPLVFNQNIYGVNGGEEYQEVSEEYQDVDLNPDYVSRDEFIDIMTAMRADLLAINERLDALNNKEPVKANNEKTIIKVQQIPLEPKQHVMEEIFEIRFDFNQSTIKPEYEDLIRKLASTTQANKNIKVSVVGHTDTAGSSNYNYALGGRRAEAVQKMLIKYGIPSNQIIAVSAGEEDLKVPTPNNTPNAENRRVRVVKEVHYTEQPKTNVAPIVVEEYTETDDVDECEECEYM